MMLVESELEIGLPKTTKSLCPECGITIDAKLIEKDGKVLMRKKCPEHGITGDRKQPHVIDQIKCTKCGTCFEVCPFSVVQKI